MHFRQFALGSTAFVALALAALMPAAAQTRDPAIKIGDSDLGGVVTGPNGPEAGVWVIAETTDLPTKFAKMVVTDDKGRYVLPQLPKANYKVWVRGYGLVDSPKTDSAPGKYLDLKATPAPNEAAAAQYYPAIYWFAMLKIPDKSQFPGSGPAPAGNGMAKNQHSQENWLDGIKSNGCVGCHQIGGNGTRVVPKEFNVFKTSAEAWERRIQSGQAMTSMTQQIGRFDTQVALANFGDWTDRIAKGETPFAKPERPQGVERNIVVTEWDWGREKMYMHDEISTDRRNPTVNANGKIYGSPEYSTDDLPVLDPVTNTRSSITVGVRDPKTESSKNDLMAPSAYWGEEPIWDSQTNTHNPMMDQKGRTWFTTRIRPTPNPAFCKAGSDHPSAKFFPLAGSGRQLSLWDPKANKFTLIDTCFGTHHVSFAEDANNTLWASSGGAGGGAVGWFNTKLFDETGDEQKAQGWTPIVIDTSGKGPSAPWTEPGKPQEPGKNMRLNAGFYGVSPAPDGSVWGSVRTFPGQIVRVWPGANPPQTAISEVYNVPWNVADPDKQGYGPRGMDVDRQNRVWVPLSSGHMGVFDRRLCKGPLNGPTATGDHCPEGWTLYAFPGPQFKGVASKGSAEASYYTWVDQFNTSGLGADTPMATGNENESILALVDGKWVNMRVPYPNGFYAKGLDGRIDDPNAGWKGRGIWTTTGTRAPFHMEGGKGTLPKVVKIQIRPDPLAN